MVPSGMVAVEMHVFRGTNRPTRQHHFMRSKPAMRTLVTVLAVLSCAILPLSARADDGSAFARADDGRADARLG